ncbi:MAG: alpha/beta fold hydrolase [Ilumatobacteraceae bacterium]
MLVLAGEVDRVLPVSESAWVAAAVPGAQLRTFPGAGHMLPLERAADVAAEIAAVAASVR